MKCKYCGGNLELEMKYCPYCGRKNREAQKHAADMEQYKSDYESTKKDVYEATKNYTRVTVQVVTIAILFIAIAGCWMIQKNSDEINYYIRKSWILERNEGKYCETIDNYMEEENYLAIGNFCNAKYIANTYGTGYEEYEPVIRSARYYADVYHDMMAVVEEDNFGVGQGELDALCSDLDYFYQSLDINRYKFEGYRDCDSTENIDCMEKMNQEVSYLLMTYFNLSEEEAEEFKDKTDAQRYIFLEEKMGAE